MTVLQKYEIVDKDKGISQKVELAAYNGLTQNINQALNKCITVICNEFEQHLNKNETKDLFKKVNMLARTFEH